MPTTADYLTALISARDTLRSNLILAGVSNAATKLNILAAQVTSIEAGSGSGGASSGGEYYYATTVLNKTSTLHLENFTFMPKTFSFASEYALNHSYTLSGEQIYVIGLMSITDLVIGIQTKTITVSDNGSTSVNIPVYVTVTYDSVSEGYTLDITLPQYYCFLGESEWAVFGAIHGIDDEVWDSSASNDEDDEEETSGESQEGS